MTITGKCRHCRTALQAGMKTLQLCEECSKFAADYRLYDSMREEGYRSFQAKLMCGLADPPDPDRE